MNVSMLQREHMQPLVMVKWFLINNNDNSKNLNQYLMMIMEMQK